MPQIITIFWLIFSFVNSVVKNGEAKTASFTWALLGGGLEVALYASGGFFSAFGVPQVLMVAVIGGAIIYSAAHHGEVIGAYSPAANLIAAALLIALLNWGGFWAGAF